MRRRIIFLDVDGTIYDQHGSIPDSAVAAIKKMQKKGHKVLLCTGRSKGECSKSLYEIGFDGMVGAAGAYAELDGKVLFHRPMEQEGICQLVDLFEKENIACAVESNEGIFGNEAGIEVVEWMIEQHRKDSPDLPEDFLGEYQVAEDIRKVPNINKVLFFNAEGTIEDMEKKTGYRYSIVKNSIAEFAGCSGEISEKGMSKAKGIEEVIKAVPETMADTVGIGDGYNDSEMIQVTGVGIAMGNAVEQLKKIADRITKDVSEDGLAYALDKIYNEEW